MSQAAGTQCRRLCFCPIGLKSVPVDSSGLCQDYRNLIQMGCLLKNGVADENFSTGWLCS